MAKIRESLWVHIEATACVTAQKPRDEATRVELLQALWSEYIKALMGEK